MTWCFMANLEIDGESWRIRVSCVKIWSYLLFTDYLQNVINSNAFAFLRHHETAAMKHIAETTWQSIL